MLVLTSPQIMQETANRWRLESRVALVPTMGALHEGHLSLMKRAKELGQKCIVSIFVNPLQFGKGEDFEKYPRPFDEDIKKAESVGVDCIFAPSARDFYPDGYSTKVTIAGLTEHLCGASRPGHFDGVATVCTKLFQATQADFAVFGEKDFQQLRVIQTLVSDLNLPVSIVAHPTLREEDGLALSSRNRYLSEDERQRATVIPVGIEAARTIARTRREVTAGDVILPFKERLTHAGLKIDYVEICPERDLIPARPETPLESITKPRLFVAAKAGDTRLIDNAPLVVGAFE